MTAIARMAMLDLRTVAPYRIQGLVLFGLVNLIDVKSPVVIVPALTLLFTSQVAAYPFNVADKTNLETLYSVLPLPRRTVLLGHYTWALASFLATAAAGTTLALLLARAQSIAFGDRTLVMMLTLSWALFATNVAIQFPLLIRFGYTRTSAVATTVPLALIMLAVIRLNLTSRLHVTIASVQAWLPLVWVAGVAAIMASAAVALTADRRRVRYS